MNLPTLSPGTGGVYAIRHRPTGRCYVGSSAYLTHRLIQHRGQLRRGVHPNAELQTDWNTGGPDAFDAHVIVEIRGWAALGFVETQCLHLLAPNVYNRRLDAYRASTPPSLWRGYRRIPRDDEGNLLWEEGDRP